MNSKCGRGGVRGGASGLSLSSSHTQHLGGDDCGGVGTCGSAGGGSHAPQPGLILRVQCENEFKENRAGVRTNRGP